MTHSNDNDPDFISLAALTANVVTFLQGNQGKDENAASDRDSGSAREKDASADSEYIDRRLADLAAFERRARGEVVRKRKM